MPEIKNNFLQGKMNKDLDDRLVPNGQYRDALNIKISKSDGDDIGTVQNIKGNTLLYSSSLGLSASIETIGKYVDQLTGDIFWFVTDFSGTDGTLTKDDTRASSSNVCRIYYANARSSSAPEIIINSYRLNFSKNHPIHHVNLIDNLLFWTDNYNQPRRINIKATTNIADLDTYYTNDAYLEDKISVAQIAPASAPKVIMDYDFSTNQELAERHGLDKFIKFAYRYKFENNEYSLMSPFSQACFIPGDNTREFVLGDADDTTSTDGPSFDSSDETKTIKSTIVDFMINKATQFKLKLDLPSFTEYSNVASAKVGSGVQNEDLPITNFSGTGPTTGQQILTERGDYYVVDDGSGSTEIRVSDSDGVDPALAYQSRLYFFASTSDTYGNPAKISEIEILISESNSAAVKVVGSKKITGTSGLRRAVPISDTSAKAVWYTGFEYKHEKPIKTLPEAELIRVSDVIPTKAKTQEVSGNRVIYGNFLQNRSITGALNLTGSSRFSISSGELIRNQESYGHQSVKQNRQYSVGLILSDRYGRQSTVHLPEVSVTSVDPVAPSVVLASGVLDYKGTALKATFTSLITDVYNKDTNPLGWYSYRFVVKQTQQEYYNVYSPGVIDNIPTGNTSSWLVLHGDNINKVPRDITETNREDGTQGSLTSLLPKVINTSGTQTQSTAKQYLKVISIGTGLEQGLFESGSTSQVLDEFYNYEQNPLIAQLPDGFGQNWSSGLNPDSLVVFETKPFESVIDIYYETSSAGLVEHLNAAITAASNNYTFDIEFFNTFIIKFRSGQYFVEESRIRGDFNGDFMPLGPKAYLFDENYDESRRINALIYSGIYNSRTGINRTNVFSAGEPITRAVDIANGSIQKLHAEDTNLNIFQEDKVSYALIDKDALFTAEGGRLTASGAAVIGQIVPYLGKYGISQNPESFAVKGVRKYFADKKRGAILRLSRDGITEISMFGMKDYFRDNLKNATKIVGGYDDYSDDYIVSIHNTDLSGNYNTLNFNESNNGWVSLHGYKPQFIFSSNKELFTINTTDIWKHNSNSTYNNYYGVQNTNGSNITFIANQQVSSVKNFNTINYEGDSDWKMVSSESDLGMSSFPVLKSSTSVSDGVIAASFIKKENKYYAHLKDNTSSTVENQIVGLDTTGIKGFFTTVKMENTETTKKELFIVSHNVVKSS